MHSSRQVTAQGIFTPCEDMVHGTLLQAVVCHAASAQLAGSRPGIIPSITAPLTLPGHLPPHAPSRYYVLRHSLHPLKDVGLLCFRGEQRGAKRPAYALGCRRTQGPGLRWVLACTA